MFTQFSDFTESYWDEQNRIQNYFTRFRDRVVSLSYDDPSGLYIVCLNNPNYDPACDVDSPIWKYTSWDATLLLDFCSEDFHSAMAAANRFLKMENIPTIHPEYLPISNI